MSLPSWRATLLALVVMTCLAGCSGNYKYNDKDYRPLGDPQTVNPSN